MVGELRRNGRGVGLALDRLTVNPGIARRLPFAVACRYRALPVAEDGGRITVAMADPDDPEARRAVQAAVGPSACLVSSHPLVIDGLIAQVWPGEVCHGLRIVVYPQPGAPWDALDAYAQAIGALLQAEVRRAGGGRRAPCDLALVSELPGQWPAGRERGAVLVAHHPRWPLRHVLLVLSDRSPAGDGLAPAWAVRLARPGQAAVTLLALAPPGAYGDGESGLGAWLAGTTAAGHRVRRAAGLLVEAGLDARLRLRQGSWRQEIARELAIGDVDLAVLDGTPGGAELAALVAEAPCPVLLAAGRP